MSAEFPFREEAELEEEEAELEEEAASARSAFFDLDIDQESAPFKHVVRVVRGMRQSRNPVLKKQSIEYYPKIVKAFEKKWGSILSSFISRSNAIVVTDLGHLKHLEQAPDISSLEIIHECDKLKIEAHRLLKETDEITVEGKNRDLLSIVDLLYEILSHLFGSMDRLKNKKVDEETHKKLVKYLSDEFIEIKEHFFKCAQRRALTEYYNGMLQGLGIIVIISFLTFFLYNFVSLSIISAFSGSLIAGGIGAIISVMQRMKTGGFKPDYEAGLGHNSRLGRNRPIIGAVMGVILYLLMMSGLLPLDIPVDASKHLYYILSIAFTAGFTERWAEGMLPDVQNKSNEKEEDTQTETNEGN